MTRALSLWKIPHPLVFSSSVSATSMSWQWAATKDNNLKSSPWVAKLWREPFKRKLWQRTFISVLPNQDLPWQPFQYLQSSHQTFCSRKWLLPYQCPVKWEISLLLFISLLTNKPHKILEVTSMDKFCCGLTFFARM